MADAPITAGAPAKAGQKTYLLTDSQMRVVERLHAAFCHHWKASGGIAIVNAGDGEKINFQAIDEQSHQLLKDLGLDPCKKISGIISDRVAGGPSDR